MQQIQQQINLYHTLFYVCLGICIFCFLLSLFFFFKFDIRNIFNSRTGRSVKKTVQKVDERNARTGQLHRAAGRGNTGPLGRTGSLNKKKSTVRQVNMNDIIQPPVSQTEPLTASQMPGASMPDVGATEVLKQEEQQMTPEQMQKEVDESYGMFRLEKYIMLIHTDEVI